MEARLRVRHALTHAPQPLHRSISIRVAMSSLATLELAWLTAGRVVAASVSPAVPAMALSSDLRCNKSLLPIGYLCLLRPLPYPYRPADTRPSIQAAKQGSPCLCPAQISRITGPQQKAAAHSLGLSGLFKRRWWPPAPKQGQQGHKARRGRRGIRLRLVGRDGERNRELADGEGDATGSGGAHAWAPGARSGRPRAPGTSR